MTNARRRAVGLLGAGALAITSFVAFGASHAAGDSFGYQSLKPVQQRHVSGLLAAELGGGTNARLATPFEAGRHGPANGGRNRLSGQAWLQHEGERQLSSTGFAGGSELTLSGLLG